MAGPIDPKHMIERQGKTFVLYSGLLDFAHELGLTGIRTELLQVPSEANKNTAICVAVAKFGGNEFSGIGDAAPNNVAPQMQLCLIRMAETRAKARALRDGTNIGVAAFEELGAEEEETPQPKRNSQVEMPVQRYVPAARANTPVGPQTPVSAPPAANTGAKTLKEEQSEQFKAELHTAAHAWYDVCRDFGLLVEEWEKEDRAVWLRVLLNKDASEKLAYLPSMYYAAIAPLKEYMVSHRKKRNYPVDIKEVVKDGERVYGHSMDFFTITGAMWVKLAEVLKGV